MGYNKRAAISTGCEFYYYFIIILLFIIEPDGLMTVGYITRAGSIVHVAQRLLSKLPPNGSARRESVINKITFRVKRNEKKKKSVLTAECRL